MATLSANGQHYKPHLVKEVVDPVDGKVQRIDAEPLPPVNVKPENVAIVKNAMVGVAKEGTSAAVFVNTGYVSGGKTGTAQVVGIKANEKYNASKLEEHLRDHALYIAFAPADDPKIVVALVVENAGFGADAAAPIARRVFDYWLQGLYPTPEDIEAVQQAKAKAPLKPPVPVAQAASALLAASAPEIAASRTLPPVAGALSEVASAPLAASSARPPASGASR
jgi:penicillin-binding protein 2